MNAFIRTQIGFFILAKDDAWTELEFVLEISPPVSEFAFEKRVDMMTDWVHDHIVDLIQPGLEEFASIVIMTENGDDTITLDGVDIDKTYYAIQEWVEATDGVAMLTHRRIN